MPDISASEAARRLGVTVARIHQRIADGSLPSSRVGNQWVVDELSVEHLRGARGRPLSSRSAWALVLMADHGIRASGLRSAEVHRLGARLELLQRRFEHPPGPRTAAAQSRTLDVLRTWLRLRAGRQQFYAAGPDVLDLGADPRVLASGVSHDSADLSAGVFIEGYVADGHVDDLIAEYLLSPVNGTHPTNVVLHVVPSDVLARLPSVGPLLVATDLADHRGRREDQRAVVLLHQLATGGTASPDEAGPR